MTIISIARTVLYCLNAADAEAINRRRTTGASIAARMKIEAASADRGGEAQPPIVAWPAGAQAHIGNEAREGQECPAIVVALNGAYNYPEGENPPINLQVMLDGNDVYWVKDAPEIPDPNTAKGMPGHWRWPKHV